MVGVDHKEASELSLRAGVRLERYRGESGDLCQRALQLVEQLAVAVGLIERREWMNLRETGPGNRHHLSGRVQLHRARAERNHGVHEREVARLKLVHVAEHFCLRVVLVEYRMRQERSRPVEALVVTRVCSQSEILDSKVWILSEIESNEEVGDVVVGDGFIESNDDASVVHEPHVDSTTSRFIHDRLPVSLAKRDPDRVEVVVVHDAVTESPQTLCQPTRECVYASRNLREC